MTTQALRALIQRRWQHVKGNGTAYAVALSTLLFVWNQWPTRTGSKLPDVWVTVQEAGFQAQFEAQPERYDSQTDAQQATVFTLSRKGIDFMLQSLRPGTEQPEDWLARAKKIDAEQFSGSLAMEWRFQKQGLWVEEYAITNDNHFVQQVRVVMGPTQILKWSAAFKEKEDAELTSRVLGFLDSVSWSNGDQ